MNRKKQRLALINEARTIGEKAVADGRDLTEDEQTRVLAIKSEVAELDVLIKSETEAREAIKALGADSDDTDVTAGVVGGAKASGVVVTERGEKVAPLSIGEAFVKSDTYAAFRKAHPSGLGTGSQYNFERVNVGTAAEVLGRKADLLTTGTAHVPTLRLPTLDLVDRPRLTLLDLISRGSMAGNFDYVQVTGVTRRAGIVAEATGATDVDGNDEDPLKPVSTYTTALGEAKAYTYADGYEVTTQMLSDAPAFATWLNAEIPYSIDTVLEDMILNGDGTNGTPKGILHTTGVQSQAFATDALTSIRKGISKINRVGGSVTAVVVSPELDEELDLLKDSTGRFLGQGPWGTGPGTVWGRPRVVSELLAGTKDAILGDWSTVALLDREGLSIEAFTQHKDFAQRNKVYVRAELRAGQVIWRPNRLAVVKVAAP